jgi:hypothetical protein
MHGNSTWLLLVYLSLSQTNKNYHVFLIIFYVFVFYKFGEQEGWNRFCPEAAGVRGEGYKSCIQMYVNAKMIPVENVLGIRGGVNSNMIYLIQCIPTQHNNNKKQEK